MKRIISVILSMVVLLSASGALLSPAYAVTNVSKEKAAYKKALEEEKRTKEAYAKKSENYKKGSFGFYQWIADTKTGWMKEDAEEALLLLNTSSFKNYTEQGDPDDATDLDNMKDAINLLKTLSEKRANDEIFPDLQPLTIRSVFMARAQVQANVSSYEPKHMIDKECDLANCLECLAWGYSDPFIGWYNVEKKNFIKKRDYTLKKYNVDCSTIEFNRYINQPDFDFNAYLEETKKFGETGHYKIVCYRGVINHNFTGDTPEISLIRSDIVFFGLAYSGYGGCHSLEVSGDDYPNGYTVEEYTDLFNEYYNEVSPENELDEYNEAKRATKNALKSLKASARPSKLKAKRNKSAVNVQWKKISGVSGYQISATTKKSKTKVIATVGKKAVKKKISLKKAKPHYIKIRTFVVIDGEKVYSSWSKPIKTR